MKTTKVSKASSTSKSLLQTIKVAAVSAVTLAAFSAMSQELPQDGVYKDQIDWGILMDMSGPTSGSQAPWVVGFQDYMRKLNEGATFLIVEHDIPVIMDISDKIVVLDFGRKIAEGTASEVQNNPLVIAAYLGDEH